MGMVMPAFIDLTGQRFGRLVVVRYLGDSRWECACDCGTTHQANATHLRGGKILSCGCYARDSLIERNNSRENVPLAQRFWAKVNKNGPVPAHRPELGECWLWTAKKNHSGYGMIREGGQETSFLQAHRYSWMLHYGRIPEDKLVCHKCDTPLCIRPEHLFIGTAKDNTQDAIRKGRMSIGEANPRATLTDFDVALIRHKYSIAPVSTGGKKKKRGVLQRLASAFGVSKATIINIVSGQTWKHLLEQQDEGEAVQQQELFV
jgi:hypothetical protein